MLEDLALKGRSFGAGLGRDHFCPAVLAAIASVPRHQHVPNALTGLAYADTPLPIGFGLTATEPLIVALMTDALDVQADHRVLEVGSGLGYQSAVLACLGADVFSVEIVPTLAREAHARGRARGLHNVTFGIGDGRRGWPLFAPYDRIVVTAAAELIPRTLLHQLAPGGRMVLPAGLPDAQALWVVDKDRRGHLSSRQIVRGRFAPLTDDEDAGTPQCVEAITE